MNVFSIFVSNRVSHRVIDECIIFQLRIEAKDEQSKSYYSLQSNLSLKIKKLLENMH